MAGWTLAIDVGTTSVTAAIDDGGRTEIVEFEGTGALSPAVFCPDAGLPAAGRLASEKALEEPGRIVPSPKQALIEATEVTIAGHSIPLHALYAAILAEVSVQASHGREPATPSRLILTFPSGPRGQEIAAALRAAARMACLPVPELVYEAVAAASHLAADTRHGRYIAILDAGGCSIDAAVLCRTIGGFRFAGPSSSLSRIAGDDPAMALRQGINELLSTIACAGLTPSQLSAIHVTGSTSRLPQTADLISEILGVQPRLAPNPATATVLGAIAAGQAASPTAPTSDRPRDRAREGIHRALGTRVDQVGGVSKSTRGPSRRSLLIAGVALGSVAAAGLGVGLLRTGRPPIALPVTLKGITDGVASVVFSPDGRWLAVGGLDDRVRLWDMTAPRITKARTIRLPPSEEVNTMSISPDSRTLAVAGGYVYFYDLATGRMSPSLLSTGGDIACAAFSPDGKTIVGGCSDWTVRLWEVATMRPIATLDGLVDYVTSVAFSSNGRTVAGCCEEEARLWEFPTGRPIATIKPTASSNAFVAFTPDGKTLVTGGGSDGLAPHRQIDLWDVATGNRAAIILPGHTFAINSVVFTPDGQTIIGAGAPIVPHIDAAAGMPADGEILQWDIATRKTIAVVPVPAPDGPLNINSAPYQINALALSPDGSILAAGGVDGTVHLLSTSASKLRA
jgi:WD40 repeat protein